MRTHEEIRERFDQQDKEVARLIVNPTPEEKEDPKLMDKIKKLLGENSALLWVLEKVEWKS